MTSLIQVDDPSSVEAEARVVAFVYDLGGDGLVNVEEQQAPSSMAENLVGRADPYGATPSPAASAARFEIVPLGDLKALLISQGGVGAEVWVQGGVLYQVTGPSITPDRAQALAKEVYAAAVAAA